MPSKGLTKERDKSSTNLAWEIGVAAFCRLLLNTARRFAYPFAPALSRGLGVSLTSVTSLIAANQITGILGLLFGPLGDRWGYRIMLLAGLSLLAVGMLVGGIFPFYTAVLTGLFLAGLGKSIYDPALQAYVGEKVPYERRGTVIGLIEMAWAGSTLVGVPLVGLLIDMRGWQAPFFVLGGIGLLGTVALAMLIPKRPEGLGTPHRSGNLWAAWRELGRKRAPLGVLGFAFFNSVANDNFFVVYGVWLEETFGLSVVALGMTTTVIGGAELLGESLTASLADRVGLRRSVIIGLTLSGMSYAALPLLGRTLGLALTALFIVFLTVEFAIVAALSLFTEVLPSGRATMMAGYFAAAGIGRVVGALIGGPIWMAGGINAIGSVSALTIGAAFTCVIWGLWRWQA